MYLYYFLIIFLLIDILHVQLLLKIDLGMLNICNLTVLGLIDAKIYL